jgi:uncharacterized membrane protein YfcA
MPLLFLSIGLCAGLLSGLFGVGGGIVIVPLLMLFAKMVPQTAAGTSLAVLTLPVVALGTLSYYRSGNVNVQAALWVAAGLFVGAFFGARVAHALPPLVMKRLFAVLLLVVAGRLWVSA